MSLKGEGGGRGVVLSYADSTAPLHFTIRFCFQLHPLSTLCNSLYFPVTFLSTSFPPRDTLSIIHYHHALLFTIHHHYVIIYSTLLCLYSIYDYHILLFTILYDHHALLSTVHHHYVIPSTLGDHYATLSTIYSLSSIRGQRVTL